MATKKELQAALDAAGVEYDVKAKKDELEELLDANDVVVDEGEGESFAAAPRPASATKPRRRVQNPPWRNR